MQTFVTLGDLIADLYIGLEQFPVLPAQHQNVSGLALGPGGSGNALMAAARLGLPAVALGSLGDDWVGERVLRLLRADGVDVSQVLAIPEATTATAVVLRAETGEHVFLGYYGAHGPAELPAAWKTRLETAGAVLVDGWTYFHDEPALIRAGAEAAAKAGVPVLFDPGPQAAAIDREWLAALLRCASVVLMTEDEQRALARELARADSERQGPARALIVKRGAQGCTIQMDGRTLDCPGYPVPVRDLTGAGDCFAAAVAWGIITGQPWDVTGAVANAVGAAKVQKIGSALAAPTRAEVAAILRAHRPDLAGQLASL